MLLAFGRNAKSLRRRPVFCSVTSEAEVSTKLGETRHPVPTLLMLLGLEESFPVMTPIQL